MFRDLKEYQELQKLYEEKVSKTENLQEFKSKFSKPAAPVKSPMEAGMGPGAARAREMAKARIAAKNVENKKVDTKVDTLANKVDSKPPKPAGANIDTSSEIESSSAEFKANEGDKFNQNFKKQNSKPTSQKNRDKLNQSRQNQNKDRLKNQLGGVASGFKGFVDKLKAKPIERKEGQTSVRQRSNVKTKLNTQNNKETTKIIPKPNTGTDTENKSGKITPKPNTGTDTETKTNKITPKPNTGTDTEKKTSTSSSSASASDRIKAFRDKKRNLQTTAKYGSTATIQTQDGKSFKPGDPGYEEQLKKARQTMRNSMKEAYASIYNQPVEPENIDETKIDEGVKREVAKKVGQAVKKKVGKLIRQGVREKGALPGGPQKPKKGFYNVKAGPNSQYDYSGTGIKKVRPEGGGSRRVKATYGKKPEKSFMQSQKDKLEAQRQGISVKELDAARKAKQEAIKDAVAKERAPRTGVDLTKGRTPTKRTNFQDKNFKPKYEGYEPYDVVLEYLLQSEIASTIEEANNIMIEMDNETIEEIITELMVETIVRPDGTATHGAPTEPKRPAPKRPSGTNKTPRVAPAKPAMRREDFGYDAYDLILEYLLGTEQVDTIEEANYVMTEMDQQTIHDIVLEMEDALNQIDEGMIGNAMSGATRAVTSGMANTAKTAKAATAGMANTAKSVGGMVGTGVGGASSMLLKGARKAAELLKKAPKNNPIPTGTRVNPSTSATGFPSKRRMSGRGGSY